MPEKGEAMTAIKTKTNETRRFRFYNLLTETCGEEFALCAFHHKHARVPDDMILVAGTQPTMEGCLICLAQASVRNDARFEVL